MRKLALIAAILLTSASAQAGPTRSLTLASNDDQGAVTQQATDDAAKPADPLKPAEPPKYTERPSLDTKPEQRNTNATADTKANAKPVVRTGKRRHNEWTETRVINELHRYGIYW